MPSLPRKKPHAFKRRNIPAARTSWNNVADWYTGHLKDRGDYQEDLIFPGALRLLNAIPGGTYIDLACGEGSFLQGVARQIQRGTLIGIDAAPKLIDHARHHLRSTKDLPTQFLVGDVSKPARALENTKADGVTCLMAIQNIEHLAGVFRLVAQILKPHCPFVLVMNHPCFRQPRQSGWGWDEERKLQYRRVDRYKSPYEMPILAHPGAAPSVQTLSYHRPLETYITILTQAGLAVTRLEEWSSEKVSTSGPRAKAENTARAEIPLFLALCAERVTP